MRAFLELNDEAQFEKEIPELLRTAGLSSTFYASVFHDNLFADDLEAADDEVKAFRDYAARIEQSHTLHQIDSSIATYRDVTTAQSDSLRAVGRALWSFCGTDKASAPCWRSECHSCTALRTTLRSVAESLAAVSEATEAGVAQLLDAQELSREISAPRTHAQGIVSTVEAATTALKAAEVEDQANEDAERANRVETVLAGALAEINRMHDERAVDLKRIAGDFLDAEIARHEASIRLLHIARDQLDGHADQLDGHAEVPLDGDLPLSLKRTSERPAQPSSWQVPASRPLSSLLPW